jgi:DNA-directed RNA polymerase subunit RPC12/RpoP
MGEDVDGPGGEDSGDVAEDQSGARVTRRSPEETFALLGDETRVQILRALQEAGPEKVLTFSDLQDAVGTSDSGRFNYHLKKLTGHFIRKTEAGYTLTIAGGSVVGSMISGTYTATAEMDPLDMPDSRCMECGGPLRITYEDETIEIRCRDCEEIHGQFMVPPGTVEQFDREELPMAVSRWIRSQFAQAVAGFCPNCSGRMDPGIDRDEDGNFMAVYECASCGEPVSSSMAATLLFEPAVIAFAYENGIDLVETPYWELGWLRKGNTKVVSTDPLELRVRISIDAEILDVTVNESLEVVDAVRQ